MDVKHSCRCCLRCAPDKDLTTPYTHLGVTEIYADMLQQSFDIHLVLGDEGSRGICSACVGRLRDASNFKLQVQRSQAELQEALLDKVEPAVNPELAGDGEEDDSVSDVLYEEPIEKLEMVSEDEAGGVLDEDPLIKSEADVMSDDSSGADEVAIDNPEVSKDVEGVMDVDPLMKSEKEELVNMMSDDFLLPPDSPELVVKRPTKVYTKNKERITADVQSQELNLLIPRIKTEIEEDTSEWPKLEAEVNTSRILNREMSEVEVRAVKAEVSGATSDEDCVSGECSACTKVLLRNQRTHTGMKPYKCSQCDYSCRDSFTLQSHERTHTGVKPYKCSHCDYRSSQRPNLQRHERKHTGVKPYKCSHCEYRCSDRSHLRAHEWSHNGEKPYKCSHCDYRSSYRSHLRVHERTHTGEKAYKCSHCDYRCSYRSTLRVHERTHTGEKPYKCSHCDYRSSDRSHLRVHERTHTGEKPYKCCHCDYRCSFNSNLRIHDRTHTGERAS